MTSERECFVYIIPPGQTEFVTAGRLRVTTVDDGTAAGSFVYGRRYLERNDAVELDPIELRLSDRLYETGRMKGIFGAIRDAMPDYWGRRVIEKHAGRVNLEELDYLLEGPDDRAGALGFGLNQTPPAPRREFNKTIDLARLQEAAETIVANEPQQHELAAQAEELMLLGTSMGGARPKAVVEDSGALWLAKFSRYDDRWNQPKVEHGALLLARACGLDTADSKLVTVGGKDVLMVRRFDREKQDESYRRYRMVSALTLLRSSDSASDRDQWSYLLLSDELRRSSASPQQDLRELFARVCFNAAISNVDDHPRNHAMLAKLRDWRLSPAFDLGPTPSVSVERRDLALACGPQGRYANRSNIVAAHGRFLLTEDEATGIFDTITNTVANCWHSTMRRAGVSETDCEAICSAFVYEGLFHER
ncbi:MULTISPECIES: type II toxin-antitoxin system HipA family toxin [Sinorhizobium]|uniref:type II toxin-antitoxin system HipA family toxin n=1 Tax=Sinorhizobium TaxID=28105 RepID=UPI000413F909|nr:MULTISPECIES: HipA domain-containing protein [Sinorhizobium]WOS67189.1 HipA domain-containing protein [Sinorhizobium fredii GR64]